VFGTGREGKLMGKFNQYTARAAECQQKAESARNEDDKQSWLALADSWLHTAELKSSLGKRPDHADDPIDVSRSRWPRSVSAAVEIFRDKAMN
jgi:hypothetical protein